MDFPESTFEGEYSWVYHAASQGYATLAIDNLGNGDSERPDPISVVQPALQLAVLYGILGGIRTGSLPNIPKYDKIIMASHSYGSVLARLIATIFPTSGADAYILTAASGDLVGIQNAIINFQARSASAVDSRYPNLPPAYVSVSKEGLRDTIYGLDGQFDPKMLEWDSASPHVFAVGEIAFFRPAAPTAFAGPVMILTGREDQIVCGNANITSKVPDCGVGLGSNPQNTTSIFPKASVFTAYVPDDTAHNINTQYTAPESFGAAHRWLQSVGF
jgi:pimeloyl-ACP methyl ester carboxylesterase